MAEKLASLRKKGGGQLSETVLWTNNAPTSAMSSQNVTLSDSLTNYKYLKIKWRISVGYVTEANIIVDSSEFKTMGTGASKCAYLLGATGSATDYLFFRKFNYSSDTQVHFDGGYSLTYSTGRGEYSNGLCIPLQIIGLK